MIIIKSIRWMWVLLFTISCTTGIQFNTQKSAEPRFSGVKTIAINKVYLDQTQALRLKDSLGSWHVMNQKLKVDNLEGLLRKSLMANLNRFSDYQVIDLKDFQDFTPTFQKLRPLSGERLKNLDLLIDVRFAYASQQQSGKRQKLFTFRTTQKSLQGLKWVKTKDSSYQKAVTVPYSETSAELICYVEVIDLRKGSVRVLKSFNHSVSNKKVPMTTMEEMVQELTVGIGSKILKSISKYSALTTRIIDEDGDEEAVELIKSTKIEDAIKNLEAVIHKSEEKNPADIYNLGICYEILGDIGLALQMYQDAYKIDNENELYIQAMGDLE